MNKFLSFIFLVFLLLSCKSEENPDYHNWSTYHGDETASHYSSLNQISRENVHKLELAWIYHTTDATQRSQIQCNPVIVDNVLFASSAAGKVFALHAETGEELWDEPICKLENLIFYFDFLDVGLNLVTPWRSYASSP